MPLVSSHQQKRQHAATVIQENSKNGVMGIQIQKITTKPRDVEMNQFDYLIIIDKNQQWNKHFFNSIY